MYGLMRSLLESSCWMPHMDYYRMITFMLFLTLVLLLWISFLWVGIRTMFMSWLDLRILSQMVNWFLFWIFHLLLRMKLLQLLINLLQWTTIHPFLVYPDGTPRLLKMLVLISVMFLQANKLIVKRSMPLLCWWHMCLKPLTLLPTQMHEDNLNGSRVCRKKCILC